MVFEPGLAIGDEISNNELVKIFKCGNMGGMRRSKATGTLVIISDDTKGLYKDVWEQGTLHYTGMGQTGDQVLKGNQNGTLYNSKTNGIEIHLFEVLEEAVYTYRGVVVLANKPYQSTQPDKNGNMRKVWIFPLKLSPEVEEEIVNLPEGRIADLSDLEVFKRSECCKANRKSQKTETTVYYRNPYLKELVKRLAEGKCQLCRKDAPFIDKNNKPYLEEHHVKRLADGGYDVINNIVAICPNCHRKVHILNDHKDMIQLKNAAGQNEKLLARLIAYRKDVNKKSKHAKGSSNG